MPTVPAAPWTSASRSPHVRCVELTTATRAPWRAALVRDSCCAKIIPKEMIPNSRRSNRGATSANSTAAAPSSWRGAFGDLCPPGPDRLVRKPDRDATAYTLRPPCPLVRGRPGCRTCSVNDAGPSALHDERFVPTHRSAHTGRPARGSSPCGWSTRWLPMADQRMETGQALFDSGRVLGDRFADVLARARDGDERAFAELLARATHPMLLRYLWVTAGAQAEDVASQARLRAIQGLEGFRGDEPAFRRWLVTIARNLHVDSVRRSGTTPRAAGRRPDRPRSTWATRRRCCLRRGGRTDVDQASPRTGSRTLPPDQAEDGDASCRRRPRCRGSGRGHGAHARRRQGLHPPWPPASQVGSSARIHSM